LVDGFFRGFGLNGRAVIPMTLGLGCGTMAVIVTRTLETGRERLLATFLLALTIPCSAQLGVVLALLSHNGKAVILWLVYITVVFVLAGWLAAHLVPGRRSAFYMELPPLRLPVLSNVLTKAYTRMAWYFVEILPVFLSTSLALWIADRTGILQSLVGATKPWMILLGLPPQTTQMFLFGFFRRDYGAAGLYDMAAVGLLDANQLFVAAVTLTLFVPCVAQFAVMIKERGVMASLLMVMLIAAVALTSGLIANWLVSFPALRL
ncbi:nucleoside recognition domain-containing protein, partial [Thermosinus carboxydivorans]|uniref:nucleoside recognition domain-containing protein n=1 Tax=Thermosinus carboxydivorans TaxID=261685 RepID=UPI0012EA5749